MTPIHKVAGDLTFQTLGAGSILGITFPGFVSDYEFKRVWEQVEEKLNQRPWAAVLLDASEILVISPQSQSWLVNEWIERVLDRFPKAALLAVVNSGEFFGKIVINRILDHLDRQDTLLTSAVFPSEKEALDWILFSLEQHQPDSTTPLPKNEADRLQELERFKIIDTQAEEEFDALTALVAELLDVPISMISIIDENRQWFKSKVGIELQETDRSISFCHYAIMQEGVYVVDDALEHELFKGNPLVLGDPKIRSYAGAPLTTSAGFKLGALCVIDQKPRTFTDHERTVLEEYAKVVVSLIETRANP
ncbi:MAG TPA: hypothetical protein DCE41_16595 [Cytophagales bacterium]|nr:hypothetical protein [Cytophagales bacterium]HAA17632.1 hypothetical protein [Cytophagales bacterium]HAP63952.1 hypothetical protein [Cytophagales bacterium]